MNKEKVLNNLLDIRELTVGADSPTENIESDLMNIRNVTSETIKEIDSKPVMAKVFDEHAEKLFSDLNNILMEGPVDLKSWNDMVIIVTRLKPYFMEARWRNE